ncbi:hypothetical protein ACVRY7_10830 [Streptococcus ictaluri]|nr:hypothetical protein [Streptococcus ictaluri]
MTNKKVKPLTTTDLSHVTSGDNEAYDFWYRVGKGIRKVWIQLEKQFVV